MKIKSITIKNFRSYAAETTIHFDDFTAFVGRNDIGKSTVLEALDIFFYAGTGLVKLDKNDVNVSERAGDKTDISISVCFCNLPATIIIDATNETTLQDEHLLNKDGLLEITKRFPNGGSPKISICAMHPTNPDCCDLLSKKDSDLKKLIKAKSIPCDDYARNASMRTAIWQYYAEDLRIEPVEIDVTKGDTITYLKDGEKCTVTALQDMPAFHKIAVADLKKGDHIIKYGQIIGGLDVDEAPKGTWISHKNIISLPRNYADEL